MPYFNHKLHMLSLLTSSLLLLFLLAILSVKPVQAEMLYDDYGLPTIKPTDMTEIGEFSIDVPHTSGPNMRITTPTDDNGIYIEGYNTDPEVLNSSYAISMYINTIHTTRILITQSTTLYHQVSASEYVTSHVNIYEDVGSGAPDVVGKVHYVPGYGINLWDGFGSDGAFTGVRLPHDSLWKITAVGFEGSQIFYRVGPDLWVEEKYIQIISGSTSDVEQINLPVSPKAIKINYYQNYGINLWNGYGESASYSGRRLAHGSTWKVVSTAQTKSALWYQIGLNQWVMGKYALPIS